MEHEIIMILMIVCDIYIYIFTLFKKKINVFEKTQLVKSNL